jgi:uncharacterized membrane protein YphA (DoxX/SURF4 family)
LAYFILRLFVAVVLYVIVRQKIIHFQALVTSTRLPIFPNHPLPIKLLILTELAIAVALFVGAGTQYAALALIALSLKMLIWHNRFAHPVIPSRLVYFLLLGCALSLFITGAGTPAIDLPI